MIEPEIMKILQEVQPLIISHGGTITFVKYENNIVYVQLHGTCTSCPFSTYTIKLGIEERLRAKFSEIQRVDVVN